MQFGFIGFKGHGTLNLSWLVLLVLILNCSEANTCVHLKQFSSLNGRHQGGNGVLMWKPNTPSVFEAANSFDHTLSLNFMTSQCLRAAYCSLSLQATECFDIWFNSQRKKIAHEKPLQLLDNWMFSTPWSKLLVSQYHSKPKWFEFTMRQYKLSLCAEIF